MSVKCHLCRQVIVRSETLAIYEWGWTVGNKVYCSYGCMRAGEDHVYSPAVIKRMENRKETPVLELKDLPQRQKTVVDKLQRFLALYEQGMPWEDAAQEVGYAVNDKRKTSAKQALRMQLEKYRLYVPEELRKLSPEQRTELRTRLSKEKMEKQRNDDRTEDRRAEKAEEYVSGETC